LRVAPCSGSKRRQSIRPKPSLTVRLRTSVVASSDTAMLYVMCRNNKATRYIRPSCSKPSKET